MFCAARYVSVHVRRRGCVADGRAWAQFLRCGFWFFYSSSRPRIPHSAYYFGAPPPDSAYGTDPCGQIGVHHPREVVRIERDYSGGELPQFTPTYPLELEGRVSALSLIQSLWSHAAGVCAWLLREELARSHVDSSAPARSFVGLAY